MTRVRVGERQFSVLGIYLTLIFNIQGPLPTQPADPFMLPVLKSLLKVEYAKRYLTKIPHTSGLRNVEWDE